ncbi:MAG: hypothetical protein GF383_16325 [Candidatus Lokiarchaeota archaeon]|nr:hypothetical protein [Candidatus Lokiarchaeota archaeon]MBD3343327.1 hypothetical protein [Candidatus Lokiarchaeota archaeon]
MKEKKIKLTEDDLVQKVIDPSTGRDITGEYVSEKLIELEKIGDDVIGKALQEYHNDPNRNKEIFKKYNSFIHDRIGTGSIGPATAAAGPLMNQLILKLAQSLDIENLEDNLK